MEGGMRGGRTGAGSREEDRSYGEPLEPYVTRSRRGSVVL